MTLHPERRTARTCRAFAWKHYVLRLLRLRRDTSKRRWRERLVVNREADTQRKLLILEAETSRRNDELVAKHSEAAKAEAQKRLRIETLEEEARIAGSQASSVKRTPKRQNSRDLAPRNADDDVIVPTVPASSSPAVDAIQAVRLDIPHPPCDVAPVAQ